LANHSDQRVPCSFRIKSGAGVVSGQQFGDAPAAEELRAYTEREDSAPAEFWIARREASPRTEASRQVRLPRATNCGGEGARPCRCDLQARKHRTTSKGKVDLSIDLNSHAVSDAHREALDSQSPSARLDRSAVVVRTSQRTPPLAVLRGAFEMSARRTPGQPRCQAGRITLDRSKPPLVLPVIGGRELQTGTLND
jgi:hypothetical protein